MYLDVKKQFHVEQKMLFLKQDSEISTLPPHPAHPAPFLLPAKGQGSARSTTPSN